MPIIFAAPGSGKTHWINKHNGVWQDADKRFSYMHGSEWNSKKHTEVEKEIHYKLIDYELNRIKENEYIIGSLFWKHIPDAVVILDENIHKKYVEKRHDLEWLNVKKIVKYIYELASENGLKIFNTFDSATAYFEK